MAAVATELYVCQSLVITIRNSVQMFILFHTTMLLNAQIELNCIRVHKCPHTYTHTHTRTHTHTHYVGFIILLSP